MCAKLLNTNACGRLCFFRNMSAVYPSRVMFYWMTAFICGATSVNSQAAVNSIVGSGTATAQSGWKEAQRTGPQPLLSRC